MRFFGCSIVHVVAGPPAAAGRSRRIQCMVNPLALTGSLFMLQAYDRVLTWRSQATPVALAGNVAFLFLVIGLHDPVRAKMLACLGRRLR